MCDGAAGGWGRGGGLQNGSHTFALTNIITLCLLPVSEAEVISQVGVNFGELQLKFRLLDSQTNLHEPDLCLSSKGIVLC